MELNRDPLWDEQGQLRRGCTVREALAFVGAKSALLRSRRRPGGLWRELRSAPLPLLFNKNLRIFVELGDAGDEF